MAMTRRQIRQQIKKLGGKPDSATVARTEFSVNTTRQEKRFREEQARERGVHNVPIDPSSVSDPRRWYEGRPLVRPQNPEIERMKRERRESGGDKFPR